MNEVSAALQSGLILLREGLEALLVIAALAAFLKRAGVPEKVKPLYLGAGLAILASFGAAVVFELFFGGEHNDFMEAGVMVIAAALMLYMSGWLFLRQDPKAWMASCAAMPSVRSTPAPRSRSPSSRSWRCSAKAARPS